MNIHEFCILGLKQHFLGPEVSLKKKASKQENEEDPKRTKLTEENITTHQALLKEEHSDPKKVGELIKLLPPGEQQLLWKKFEKSRISASADGDYKDVTKGTGSQEKNHVLLRNCVIDGGQLAKHYKTAMLSFENTSEKKITYIFKPWKQMVDRYGKTEALARLKAGQQK